MPECDAKATNSRYDSNPFQRYSKDLLASSRIRLVVAGLGPLSETIGMGQAALRDFVAAEPVSHDIDDFLQAEIRQAGKGLSGGRVTGARDVLEIAFVLFDTGSDLAPSVSQG